MACIGFFLIFITFFIGKIWFGTKKSPNIIFILADDLDVELFNRDENLSSFLKNKGMNFSNHFAPLSLCCPSRVSTLRGQFAHNTGIFTNSYDNGGGFEGMYRKGLESSTIATWLQNAGYKTALLGKYLNGYPMGAPSATYIPPGWTYWASPNEGNPQSQYNYSLNENGVTIKFANDPKDYLGDVLLQKTIAFIEHSIDNHPNNPFFVYFSSYAPHRPATAPPTYDNRYQNEFAPRTHSFNEQDVGDKPKWVKSKNILVDTQIADIDYLYRKRKASMLPFLDLLKKLLATLEKTGELDNTYIFFSSDHGFHQGQHRLNSGKSTAYEEDIKIPLVVIGPGVVGGSYNKALTSNVDYAPTFAEIAGISVPSFVDGRSMLPYLKGKVPKEWRKVLLLESKGQAGITKPNDNPLFEFQDPFDHEIHNDLKKAIPSFAGLRIIDDQSSKSYIEYANGEHELYDLVKDPHQLTNIYENEDEVFKSKLLLRLNLLRTVFGQRLREIEQQALSF